MNELSELGAFVEADIAKNNLKELISERADDVIQSLTGITPGLSVIHKLSKTYHSVKDYFLMEKIIAFLTDLSSMDVKERKNLINKINNEPIHGQQFGKFLILAIDRLEYTDKAVYVARACKFYEREDISQSLLTKFKGVIEKIELNDLKKLKCTEKMGQFEYFGYPRNFDSEGLYLFQSLDLVLFEHTVSDFREYHQLEVARMSRKSRGPKLPQLSCLGQVFIHIINDKPFDIWLKRAAAGLN